MLLQAPVATNTELPRWLVKLVLVSKNIEQAINIACFWLLEMALH